MLRPACLPDQFWNVRGLDQNSFWLLHGPIQVFRARHALDLCSMLSKFLKPALLIEAVGLKMIF